MTKYLYVFSYQTPEQRALSAEDAFEESCEAVFIEAASEELALAWGKEIAQQFVSRLLGDPNLSWGNLGFAHWIEREPQTEYPRDILEALPVVPCGVHPEFHAAKA